MPEYKDLLLAGESLRLYADRALYWPARQRLFVSDVHLGKDDSFRAAGIALPTGVTRHDLDRLSLLIEASAATSVCFLGDLLHGPRLQAPWQAEWALFRQRHARLHMVLVEGNHDRVAARAGLDIECQAERWVDGPFVFAHAPLSATELGERVGVCGHVHPVVRVPGFTGRFAAFALLGRQLVLPAFSAFTGGWLIDKAHARYACLGPHLLDLGPTRQLPP